ncbi:MAG: thiol:disulfide interchange protein [Epsilonproteobacteria bacterium]|nr:thiol:disulfide interchange protein [Campylobacterota bacterium]NPA63891.1 protein-disulfide reductase DsbD [Campylobacterota bacterium]
MRVVIALFMSMIYLFGFGFVDEMPKIVPVEKAYKPSVELKKDGVRVSIQMADKVYVYKDKIELLANQKPIDIRPYLPKPMILHGDEVYEGNLSFKVPLEVLPKEVTLTLKYQGCNEVGICYPPQKKEFRLTIPTSQKVENEPKKMSEEEAIASTLKNRSIWIVLMTFFGFGLLLALTPCIFPMIPILSSLIVGAKDMNTKKAFIYSLVYVLAMSVTYTIAGVLAGLFGANLQAAFQNPIAIVLFAAIFVALALSMFGFYEIGLPASIQTRLAKKSDEAGSKGGLIGVAIMGFLSALIVGPCVAPPLAGALVYIGQTGDALLGGLALFAMSLGMGMPLILVGVGAGRFMPKPGGWMEAVSRVFGVVMLGVAIWMLERILPPGIALMLWAALFIFSAVYLRALEGIEPGAHWFAYFKKSVGIILFIYGIFLMIGSVTGATSLLDPLKVLKKGGIAQVQERELFRSVNDLEEFKKILASSNKPVLLDITAKWCASCKELEENTFSDPRVQEALKDFRALRLDVTDNSRADKEFLKAFGLYGPPAILFFDKEGEEIKSLRVVGYKDPEAFLRILKEAKERFR